MFKARLKGLSGLLSPGRERRGSRENETNGKAHPVKATHFDYITKPTTSSSTSNGSRSRSGQEHNHNHSRRSGHDRSGHDYSRRSSQDHPRAPKQHQSQGSVYSRSRQERQDRSDRSDRPPRDDRRYRPSGGEYKNGAPTMHQYSRPEVQRRYSREDDEELMRINQQSRYDDRGPRRGGSLPGNYSQGRNHSRGGSLPNHYSQGSPGPNSRGPPKPPRRQDSLNRVHIPEGPDTEYTTSPSDYDIHSPSDGSSSPRNWKVSPLMGPNSPSAKQPRERAWSPTKDYPRSPTRRHSSEKRHQQYDNQPYEPTDQEVPVETHHRRCASNPEPLSRKEYERNGYERNGYERNGYERTGYEKNGYEKNGYQRQNSFPTTDPYIHENGSSRYGTKPDVYRQYSYEEKPAVYDYGQQPYEQQWQDRPNPTRKSFIIEKPEPAPVQLPVEPKSTSRPLMLPQNERVPAGPRPIYRSDGEIDLREPSYRRRSSREQEEVIPRQVVSAPTYQVPPPNQWHAPDNYSEPYVEPKQREAQWEEPKQNEGQTSSRQTNSLRTVRDVKAYDQHVKKYKRPTSLGGVPRQQPSTSATATPRPSSLNYPVSDEGVYPSIDRSLERTIDRSLERPQNSAFIREAPQQPSQISTQNGSKSKRDVDNYKYFEPPRNYPTKGYPETSYGQPQKYQSYPSKKESTTLPADWPADYPAQMIVRSPVPADNDNATSSLKQMDTGKQTMFCLVSQVMPASPSPETVPNPVQREFVKIKNGTVSPVMEHPIRFSKPVYNQFSQSLAITGKNQHGSYSPVRSQMEYQAPQSKSAWEQQTKAGTRNQDSSTRVQDTTAQPSMTKTRGSWSDNAGGYRGASVSSGYFSSPEYDKGNGEVKHQGTSAPVDSEYHFGGPGKPAEIDDAPAAPVKDLIKKINKNVIVPSHSEQVMANKQTSADLKTILIKDAVQSDQVIRDDTSYGTVAFSMSGARNTGKVASTKTPKASGTQTPKESGTQTALNNEKYINATAITADSSARGRTYMETERLVVEPPVNASSKEPESEGTDEDDGKAINAKDRRAYFESLKPLSKEEEISSVFAGKPQSKTKVNVAVGASHKSKSMATNTSPQRMKPSSGTQTKKIGTQSQAAIAGNIKDLQPADKLAFTYQKVKEHLTEIPGGIKDEEYTGQVDAITQEPAITYRAVKETLGEYKKEGTQSPFFDDLSDEHAYRPGQRQAYYDRLKQRGQGVATGTMGRRSQSLPRLNAAANGDKLGNSKVSSKSIEELTSIEDEGSGRMSTGAKLFKQKQQEMERRDKKQEIFSKVKNELMLRKSGSEPNLAAKQKERNATFEKNKHLLNTHIAGKRIRGKDDADFEFALTQLQHVHKEADRDEHEPLHPKFYQPFDHRASEIPRLAGKIQELQQMLGVQSQAVSGKHRRKGKRYTSDVSEMRPPGRIFTDGDGCTAPRSGKKGQDFFPYRQSTHPKKMGKNEPPFYEHDSTSDEDKTPRPTTGTNPKLYRPPRSSDNLGFSSDSSPERPVRVKGKTVPSERVRLTSPVITKVDARSEQHQPPREDSPEREPFWPVTLRPVNLDRNIKPVKSKTSANVPPPIKQSVKYTEVPQLKKPILTKPPPAPAVAKTKDLPAHLQVPCSRDSVSTVDSAGLAQPFDDINDEYHHMMMDHQAVEVTPMDTGRASSLESLFNLVSQLPDTKPQSPQPPAPERPPSNSYAPLGDIPLADEEEFDLSSPEDGADLEGLRSHCIILDAAVQRFSVFSKKPACKLNGTLKPKYTFV